MAHLPSDLETAVTQLSVRATPLPLVDQAQYDEACVKLELVQKLRRKIVKHFTYLREPISIANKRNSAARDHELARLVPIESGLNTCIVEYQNAQAAERDADAEALSALSLATGVPVAPLAAMDRPPTNQHRRETVSVTVTDLAALVSAVADFDGRAPLECLRVHLPTLNRLAREQGDLFHVPGCQRVVSTKVISR